MREHSRADFIAPSKPTPLEPLIASSVWGKNKKNISDLSRCYPAIPAALLPKAPKKLSNNCQQTTKKTKTHSKSTPKPSRAPPQESNQQKHRIFCFCAAPGLQNKPWKACKNHKNQHKLFIFSVGFPKNSDTLCCHLFSSSGVPRSSEMSLKHNACNAFRATPKIGKLSKFC